MDKAQEIEKKLYELIANKKNLAVNWYASGHNFISWDITPMKKSNFTRDFLTYVELLGRAIFDKTSFYCTPETMVFNGWVRLTIMF